MNIERRMWRVFASASLNAQIHMSAPGGIPKEAEGRAELAKLAAKMADAMVEEAAKRGWLTE